MFLNELDKNEGIAFLQLVKALSNVDNIFAKEEKKLYTDYLEELDIKESEVEDEDLSSVCQALKNSTQRKRNIIYFELVGLALIDGEYEEKEVDFLEKVGEELIIKRDKRIAFANYFYDFIDTYNFTFSDPESKILSLKQEAEKLL